MRRNLCRPGANLLELGAMGWFSAIFQAHHHRRRGGWLLAALALCLGASSQFALHRPLINDEALELLQAEGLPLDHLYFLTPDTAYAMAPVDTVETWALYANHALFRLCAPWLKTRAAFLVPVRLWCLAGFVGACLLFYGVACRRWAPGQAWVAGLLLAASSYALLMNQFVTRNAWSLWWATLLVYALDRWLREDNRLPTIADAWPQAALAALALTMGCWTYTSFKLMAAALYGGLFAAWLRFDRRPAALWPIAASAILFAGALAGLILADGKGFSYYLARGGYALTGAGQYVRLLALTLASPFYYVAHGGFIEDDVHVVIGRPPLGWLLEPFFIVGWARAWMMRRPFWFWTAAAWTIAMLLCALGGPNLKYLFAFFPLTLLLAALGLFGVGDWLEARRPGWPRRLAPVFLCCYLGLECRQLFFRVPRSDYFEMNSIPPKIAQTALTLARRRPAGTVLAQPGVGFDLLNWYLWPPDEAARIRRWPTAPVMMNALAGEPPLPPGTMLVTDYPAREVFAEAGKPLPPSVEIINVRDKP